MSRRMRTLALVATAALVLTGLSPAGASDGSGSGPSRSIAGLVAASGGEFDTDGGDFDILLNAVVAAGLVDALDTTPDLTVLAPTDAAFVQTARDLGYSGMDEAGTWSFLVDTLTALGGGDPIPVLTNILSFHVVPGVMTAGMVTSADSLPTLLGTDLTGAPALQIGDNEPDLPNPSLIASALNFEATNGFVHAIDRVLLPIDTPATAPADPPAKDASTMTLVDLALASGGDFDADLNDYDLLVQAVVAAGLVDVLADPDAALTVFAPDDRAFVRLANDLGYVGHDEAGAFAAIVDALTALGGGDPIPVLTNVLLYHVAPGRLTVSDVVSSGEIVTALGGATLQPTRGFRLIDNEPDLENPRMRLRKSNVHASNGVLHTIDRVLIPVDLP